MRIVVAPDKFKDCLSAVDVANAIARGLHSIDPSIEIDACPMADGGEGTVAALVAATDALQITVACDVTNPLCGPNGAARVFGPQKGATPAQVEQLDAALHELAARLGRLDLEATPGAGAAGGLGFGMMAYYGATLHRG